MRVAFVIPHLEVGGAQRQLALLASRLAVRGHAVRVVVLRPSPGRAVQDIAGVEVVVLGPTGPGGRTALLARRLREFRPDVVHGYLDAANVAIALVRPFLGRTAMVWGVRMSDLDRRAWSRTGRAVFRLSCTLARTADLVISNSVAGREVHIALGYPPERTVVVHNGIDEHRFRPDPEGGSALRASWGVGGAPLVGCVARIDPMKDHETLLRAVALVREVRPDVTAVCIGPDPDGAVPALAELAEHLGIGDRVRWLPTTGDVAAAMSAFDVFCLASAHGEGFPNVVGEAMACGTSCVVTDVGDSAVVVGGRGTVVPPGRPDLLAGALLEALARPADAGGLRDSVVSRFGVEAMVDRTERHLTTMLDRSRRIPRRR